MIQLLKIKSSLADRFWSLRYLNKTKLTKCSNRRDNKMGKSALECHQVSLEKGADGQEIFYVDLVVLPACTLFLMLLVDHLITFELKELWIKL